MKVETPGKTGIQSLDKFPPGTKFHAMRTKVGGSVSIVADVGEMPKTNYGVVVIGTQDDGSEVVWTAHPGLPGRSGGKDTFAEVEGRTLTRDEIVAIAGTNDVGVNTRLRG